jgi:hypothetical protein
MALHLTAGLSLADTLTQNFESESLGSSTPPAGWSLKVVTADPQTRYTTTNGASGAGLGGEVMGNHTADSSGIPGAYLVNSGSPKWSTERPISGSFNFYIPDFGNYSSGLFMIGNIKDGISGTNAAEWVGIKLVKNTFSTKSQTVNGIGTGLSTTAGTTSPNTWYLGSFSWTPTSGTTGNFIFSVSGANTWSLTNSFTFSSPIAYFGFGSGGYFSVDMSLRFDNINITGSPLFPPGTIIKVE